MLNYCLSATERTGDRSYTAFCKGEKRIYYSLTRNERRNGRKLFGIRSTLTYRPLLKHTYPFISRIGRNYGYRFVYIEKSGPNRLQRTFYTVGNHYSVFDNFVLFYATQNVALLNEIALFCYRHKRPLLFVIERRNFYTSVDSVAAVANKVGQRSLNTVENTLHQARSKFDAERCARTLYFFAGSKHTRLFVNLNGSFVASELYNLADKSELRNSNDVVHLYSRHSFGYDQGTGHLNYFTFHALSSAKNQSLPNNISAPIARSTSFFMEAMP